MLLHFFVRFSAGVSFITVNMSLLSGVLGTRRVWGVVVSSAAPAFPSPRSEFKGMTMRKQGVWLTLLCAGCLAVPVASARDLSKGKLLRTSRADRLVAPGQDGVPPGLRGHMVGGECEDACFAEADQIFQNCMLAGGTPETCGAEVQAFLDTCMEACAPEPTCEMLCHQQADQLFQDC